MSVFTTVHEQELREFLTRFNCGSLVSYEGISAGIENTNYFVTTSSHQLVLTLFEHHTPDELTYFLDLMAHLAEHDIPTAHPLALRGGGYLSELNGKPASLVARLDGRSVDHPNTSHCHEIGHALAALHLAGRSFHGHRTPDRSLPWAERVAERVLPKLDAEQAELLRDELDFQSGVDRSRLPQGVIHADLFRDNALFADGELHGIIDLYYACNDAWLYDIAVTINDWCSREDGSVETELASSLLAGYQQTRTLTPDERHYWPAMLRAGALRFWLSRLQDQLFPRDGEMTYIKDPSPFRRILLNHRDNPDAALGWLGDGNTLSGIVDA